MTENKPKRGGAREGAGRPSHFEGEKKTINLRLTVEAIEMLTEESKKTGISRSDIINELVFDKFSKSRD